MALMSKNWYTIMEQKLTIQDKNYNRIQKRKWVEIDTS